MIVNRYVNGEKTENWKETVIENAAVKEVMAEVVRRMGKPEDKE